MDIMMIYVHEMDNLAQKVIQMFYCGFIEVNSQRSKGKKELREQEKERKGVMEKGYSEKVRV